MSSDDTDRGSWERSFEKHRQMDVQVTSNAADGATIDINGTQLKIFQKDRHIPMLAEIYIGGEEQPIGAINTARSETVTLGGIDESLADRVDEIREMPVEEIPSELEELAERLNPPRSRDAERQRDIECDHNE
ncbi:hypothetical protein [Natrinema ejinorense]|uniref:Uncharacterized protein n=1 Tax=Natrinema ejinorense TaxID=373386 RepID=A0A2A5QPC2_9EURY|nr:hypothetical protein [Natrinema ejinorense]PCR88659.1 hypothetical protein CP557_21760 [Natrinema ejinorense]